MSDNRQLVGQGWVSYMERVLPPGAPEVQRIECKRAFYAGATILLAGIMAGLDEGSEPTDGDLSRMDDLLAELTAWAADRDKR